MKLLIDQPGRSGDILICLPIAEWYSKNYQVDWLCPKEYHPLFNYVNYCKPIDKVSEGYDEVIDMSFGIRQGTALHKWWIETREQWQSFVIPKYIIAEVPLFRRWQLSWKRDFNKESSLYSKIVKKYGEDYSVVQEKTHDCHITIPVKNKVLFEPIEDYTVFDWFTVLANAKEIHCIDSLLCNFVDVSFTFARIPKYYYTTSKTPNIWDKTLLINNWRFV